MRLASLRQRARRQRQRRYALRNLDPLPFRAALSLIAIHLGTLSYGRTDTRYVFLVVL